MLQKIKRTIKPYKMAIISVFIAMLSITLVSIVSMIGETEINNELNGLGLNGLLVNATDSENINITNEKIYNLLSEYPDVDKLSPIIVDYVNIEFSNSKTFEAMTWGISSQGRDIVNLEMVYGEFFTDYQTNTNNLVCVIDEELAITAYGRGNIVGKEILVNIGKGIYEFEIIGICKKTSNLLNSLSVGEVIPNFIYIPYSVMQNYGNKENYDQIIINASYNENIDKEITSYLFANTNHTEELTISVSNLSKQRDTINNIVDIAFLALFLVSCVAVIVCSISVATSVTTAVNIQKRDIGIKISLGASRINIMLEFLFSAILSCMIGIYLSVILGGICLGLVNIFLENNYIFDYSLLISGIFVTIFFTGIFSLYPSYKAAMLTPIEALNRE